jgi:hypothetical protein
MSISTMQCFSGPSPTSLIGEGWVRRSLPLSLSKERVGERSLAFSRITLSQRDLSRRSQSFAATPPWTRRGQEFGDECLVKNAGSSAVRKTHARPERSRCST